MYGGDEFVCALVDACLPLAERRFRDIAEVLSKAIAGGSISVGFAELLEDETLEAVIHRADRDMYERRNASRNDGRLTPVRNSRQGRPSIRRSRP